MAFDPYRWPKADIAIRAARIASAQGSQIINIDHWRQAEAATDTLEPLQADEQATLDAISVGDDVIKHVARHAAARTSKSKRFGGGLAK